ncbi:hypothetical protein SADUNF_Sadunf11G0118600 [Salix dunnii]|uniref:Uncharacterized protein n=1 Tax=Salix dunnii TaxID=1413687 RepID=A0A835JRB3_9ROSI|nr:hypothetical protein SADUNF_Sadunf11G0118600 [Salix dunnii]
MSLILTSGFAMATDRMPNEHTSTSKLPSPNHNPNHRFGKGCGRNWNQGCGLRRIGQWETTKGSWSLDLHS